MTVDCGGSRGRTGTGHQARGPEEPLEVDWAERQWVGLARTSRHVDVVGTITPPECTECIISLGLEQPEGVQ